MPPMLRTGIASAASCRGMVAKTVMRNLTPSKKKCKVYESREIELAYTYQATCKRILIIVVAFIGGPCRVAILEMRSSIQPALRSMHGRSSPRGAARHRTQGPHGPARSTQPDP